MHIFPFRYIDLSQKKKGSDICFQVLNNPESNHAVQNQSWYQTAAN